MPSINKVELIGNVAKVEFGITNNGSEVATVTVCTDRKYTNSKGEEHKETEFHKVTCWAKLADSVKKYVTKSNLVYVEGRIANKNWKGPDGEERFGYEIIASKLLVLKRPSYNPINKVDEEMENEVNKFINK